MKLKSFALLVTLAAALASCAMEIDQGGAPEVGVSVAALTTPTTLASLSADRVLAMGEGGAMFAREHGENCAPTERLVTVRYWSPQGEGLSIPDGTVSTFSLGCSRTIGIAADDMDPPGLFASDTVADDIVRIDNADTARKVSDTSGDARGRIVMDDEWVYWSDDLGIYKAMRAGGGRTRVIDGANLTLLGIDGQALVYKRQDGTQYWLRRVSIWGGAGTTVHTLISVTGYEDLSFDDEFYYWVDNSAATNRIRRLSRVAGSSSTTIVSSADPDTLRLPTPTDNGLFFVHNQLSGFGAVKIRRRSNAGNLSDQHTTGAYIRGMRADGAWLYWVEDSGATKQVKLASYWF